MADGNDVTFMEENYSYKNDVSFEMLNIQNIEENKLLI